MTAEEALNKMVECMPDKMREQKCGLLLSQQFAQELYDSVPYTTLRPHRKVVTQGEQFLWRGYHCKVI